MGWKADYKSSITASFDNDFLEFHEESFVSDELIVEKYLEKKMQGILAFSFLKKKERNKEGRLLF